MKLDRKVITGILSGILLTSLISCGPQRIIHVNDEEGKDKVTDLTINSKMSAESLAQAGEQLVTPFTFMLADEIFTMALEKDPENFRANFYKKFVAPWMATKGIMKRMIPYVKSYGNIIEHEKTISQLPDSPLRDFLLDGKEDIQDISGIQEVQSNHRAKLAEFRTFLRENIDQDFIVYLNPYLYEETIWDQYRESCEVKFENPDHNQTYKVQCSSREMAIKKLEITDFIALSQIISGHMLYQSLFTSYNFRGLEALSKIEEDSSTSLSMKEKLNFLESFPSFGELRDENAMKDVLTLGADLKAAYQWAIKHHQRLCPPKTTNTTTRKSRKRRPGYLFDDGICLGPIDEAEKTLALFDSILKGAITQSLYVRSTDRLIKTQVDYLAWFRNPVQNLKELFPEEYDQCGVPSSLRDPSFGGLYPEGNAELFLIESPCHGNPVK